MGHGLAFLQSISFILLSFFWLSFDHRLDATLIFAVNKVGTNEDYTRPYGEDFGEQKATKISDTVITHHSKSNGISSFERKGCFFRGKESIGIRLKFKNLKLRNNYSS
uniref:Uncharacterized protein n=1 Tax=Amphimedon queenslandica TaxID=400682 RepID=A0A1X7UYK9_AMPQE